MKHPLVLLLLLLLAAPLSSQDTKGVQPINQKPSNQIRAVVVGISDYQSNDIPDLQFAHRDAEAFAAWLRSPAGGSVDSLNLQVLLNQEATTARCLTALFWLVDESDPGDQAIIYFAGHGDTENRTRNQPGFLLLHDAPSSIYMAGGSLHVLILQDIITTLSSQQTRVLLIADILHAGKLAGSGVNGQQLTATALARQYADEVKIISCQPNEISIEGEQWGGGRSAFSWRLLEGLYGLADQDQNGQITAYEIGDYLAQTVPDDIAPVQQTPLVLGDRNTVLSGTDPALSTVLRYRRRAETPGVECAPCKQFYQDFEQALRDHTGAFDWLLREPGLTPFGEIPNVQTLVKQYAPDVQKD